MCVVVEMMCKCVKDYFDFCADMSDRLRLGRPAPTSSARREKQAQQALEGRGRARVRGSRLAHVDTAGGLTSQTGPSQMMDPTQYQYDPHYQDQAYQAHVYQEQPGFHSGYQYQEGYEYHQGYDAQFHEGYQPEQHHVEPPQQQHVEAVIEDDDGDFPGGLTSCHFYRTLVNTWHSSFGTIKQ